MYLYYKLVEQKKLTRRIGIMCKQEVIGMRMHHFKVSGLNSVHLICDSYREGLYFNLWFNCLNGEIGIAN